MSGRLKLNAVQLGDSATATNNFVLQTLVNGTMKLSRGNQGATTQDILTVDTAGRVRDTSIVFSQTFSNVASIDIPGVITSAYDLYQIEIYDVVARTANSDLYLRGSIDNGANWLTGNYSARIITNAGTVTGFNVPGTPYMLVAAAMSSGGGGAFTIKLNAGNSVWPRMSWGGGYWYNPGTVDISVTGSGVFNTTFAVNALRFIMSAGNIDAKVIVTGVKK